MKCFSRMLGYLVLAFGAGLLLAYFLPYSILVIIEALIIVAAGLLWFTKR